MTEYTKPLPVITHLTKPFWEAAKKHELLVQKCRKCLVHIFPPMASCIECGSGDLEWVRSNGKGIVYTYAVIHQDLNRGFDKDVPYVLGLIELDEGPRLYAVIRNKPEEVKIGARASVSFEDVTPEISLCNFRLEE